MLLFHPILWVTLCFWNVAEVISSGSASHRRVQRNSHSQAGDGLPTARRMHQPYSTDLQYLNRDNWPFESKNQFESPDSGLFTSDVGPHDYIPSSHKGKNPSRDSDHVVHSHYSSVRQQPEVLVRPETNPPHEETFAQRDVIENNGPTQKTKIYNSAPNRKEIIDSSVTKVPKEKHPRQFQDEKFKDPPINKKPTKYSSPFNYNDDVSDDNDSDYYTNGPSDREEYSPPDSQIHQEKQFIGLSTTEVPFRHSTFGLEHIQRPTNTPPIFSSLRPAYEYVENNYSPSERPHAENGERPSDGLPTWSQLPAPARAASSPAPPPPSPAPSRPPARSSGAGQCPSQATGAFPYLPDCRRFVNCWRGRGFVQACAPGTLFNADTRECDHPHKVHCEGGAPLSDYPPEADLPQAASEPARAGRRLPAFQPPPPAAHPPPQAQLPPPPPATALPPAEPRDPPPPRCPGRAFSGLAPHPTDCRKFLNCWNGAPFVQECGPGTVFNPRILVCDFPYRVKCNQTGSHDNSSKRTNRGQPPEQQTPSTNEQVSTLRNHLPAITTPTTLPTTRTNFLYRVTTPRTFLATERTILIPTTYRQRIPLPNNPTATYEPTNRPSAPRGTTMSAATSPSPTARRPHPPAEAPTPSMAPAPSAPPTGQALRLRGGPSPWEGFVEVAGANGGWGLICDGAGQWNLSEAAVACRQLGFHRGAEAAWQGGAAADARVAWDAVQCSGVEAALGRCWVTPARGRCDPSSQAAVVRCVRNHASLCRPGELNHAGRCFAALPPAALSAADARARCAARGARLVEILSQ
ncbi:Neurotrypsin, partial [Gryllus bimaculatus]